MNLTLLFIHTLFKTLSKPYPIRYRILIPSFMNAETPVTHRCHGHRDSRARSPQDEPYEQEERDFDDNN